MNVWTTEGSVWPTLSVSGMARSSTILKNRNKLVVLAYEPIPNVSKKFVKVPTPICRGFGKPGLSFDDVIMRVQPAINTTVTALNAARSPVIGFMRLSLPQEQIIEVSGQVAEDRKSTRLNSSHRCI